MTVVAPLHVVGVSGSPSVASRSRLLLEMALSDFRDASARTTLVDLATLPADGLLGRRRAPEVDLAIETVLSADVVIAATPVYRATYTGLLKLLFDQLPPHSLARKVSFGIATAGSAEHEPSVAFGLRSLFTSLDAVLLADGVFAADTQFLEGHPDDALRGRIRGVVHSSIDLAESLRTSS